MLINDLFRKLTGGGAEDGAEQIRKLRKRVAKLETANADLRKRLATLAGAEQFKNRYVGDVAKSYDSARSRSAMWKKEHAFVEKHLGTLAAGSTVLDLPVGTGRFVPIYAAMGLKATGLDSSDDMLAEAAKKAAAAGLTIDLAKADALKPPCADNAFDAVVCIRMLNFFRAEQLTVVMDHLARMSRSLIIFTIRVDDTIDKPMAADRKHTIVHPTKTLDDFIRRHGLTVIERSLVDTSESGQNVACALRK